MYLSKVIDMYQPPLFATLINRDQCTIDLCNK
jgi:hypothetical protein